MEEAIEKENESLSVGGYLFYTEADARLARAEEQKIEYLEARIDYTSPESIRYVYEKAIHERVFKTPVGLQYLKRQQEYLKSQPGIEPGDVTDIPLFITFGGEIREYANPARARVAPSAGRDRKKFGFTISVILNVMLVLAIISMFCISFLSENPNIINYERVLTNKYAAWEQELTEREQAVREKELELKLQQ